MSGDYKKEIGDQLYEFCADVFDQKLRSGVRTSIPGYFLSFDPETQLAKVQVGIKRLFIGGVEKAVPPIVNCPVCVYGASGGAVEVKIEKGDECLIHFSMRCIDGWRPNGGIAPPVRKEIYRESDAFIELGARSISKALTGYANNGIKLRSKDGANSVWIKDDETIVIQNPAGAIITLDASGQVIINGLTITPGGNIITASGASLDAMRGAYNAHTHGASPTTSHPV